MPVDEAEGRHRDRALRVCAREGLAGWTAAPFLGKEGAEAARGVRDREKVSRPGGWRHRGSQGAAERGLGGQEVAVGPRDAWNLFLEVLQFLGTARSGVDHGSEQLTQGGGHGRQEKRWKNRESKGRKDCWVDLDVTENDGRRDGDSGGQSGATGKRRQWWGRQ